MLPDFGREIESPGGSSSGQGWLASRPEPRYGSSQVLAEVRGLATTATTLFTVPDDAIYLVSSIDVFNRHTATDLTITFRIVPATLLVTDTTCDFNEFLVQFRRKYTEHYEMVFPSGYRLVALASTANFLNVRVHGMDLVQQ